MAAATTVDAILITVALVGLYVFCGFVSGSS